MEMPSNVIIVVSIVVVVLVVLSGALSQFSQKPQCEASGGFCASYCSQGFTELQFSCPKEVSSCCIETSQYDKVEIVEGDLFP